MDIVALTEQLTDRVINFVSMIRPSDFVDIAILSFLVYKLLWALRKNSSGRVLKGVLVIIVAMVLAPRLRLYGVSYLLNRTVEWGVLTLVILFQPELRRFLERMGDSRLSSVFIASHNDLNSLDNAIQETVEAYTSLSRDKVGALMVFERQNLLDDVIKTGTALDASVSSELLKNLFWNKAPLHDGAVIVRNGRIIGAGCMLPMSGNVNLSRDLGMRHRAGIGVSEHTDALVAIGGMLKRHLAPETLERLLRNELMANQAKKEGPPLLPLLTSLRGKNRKGERADGEK